MAGKKKQATAKFQHQLKKKARDPVPPVWKNRIDGHGEEAPDQLLANPKNWRLHPAQQQAILALKVKEGE